ncbi:hypothetical protein DL771_007421 [Monosporascus sp. 5C6A]|nr:hypothetical protein DL771_007421 [Monosporascus sp. 5C6A]
MAPNGPDSYAVDWIAALPIERSAAEAMLNEEYAAPTGFTKHQTDANVYTGGRVGEHNIVIASLPAGVYGTTSAASYEPATHHHLTIPCIKPDSHFKSSTMQIHSSR